jgi:multiple sugar transport system permease protein
MAIRAEIQAPTMQPKPARGSRLTLAQRRNITGYIFIMPFILGFFLWFLIPAAVAFWLTFQSWNLISPPQYVGLANIERLFSDPLLPQSLKVTFVYTLISVPLGLIFSFFLATLINTRIRGIAIFRTIYYLPSIVPAVANAAIWAWIFNTDFGLLNGILNYLGIAKIAWLQETRYALPALILMSLWGVPPLLPSRRLFLLPHVIPQILYWRRRLALWDESLETADLKHLGH